MATLGNCSFSSFLTYSDTGSGAAYDNPLIIRAPLGQAPAVFTAGTGSLQSNKRFYALHTLTATSITLDLTAITGLALSAGDTAFTAIKALYIENQAAINSNKPLLIGNAASTSFQGPLSGTTTTFSLPAMGTTGVPLLWVNGEAAGWVCSTNKNLKLDAGANTVTFFIAILGI